jgi:hypothetical protein
LLHHEAPRLGGQKSLQKPIEAFDRSTLPHVVVYRDRQDTLVYPILFLYRQYIVLALKEIIRSALVYLERDLASAEAP